MQEVLTRKRRWKKREFEPTMDRVRYLGPSPENHGHWIMKEGETARLTRSVFKKVGEMPTPAHWIALERDLLDGLTSRRRLREKTTIKRIEVETSQETGEKRTQRIIDDEMRKVFEEPPELALLTMMVLAEVKKTIEVKEDDDEEVLQTRIVSPKEVARCWDQWKQPSQEEVDSLIVEKEALQPVKRDQWKWFV